MFSFEGFIVLNYQFFVFRASGVDCHNFFKYVQQNEGLREEMTGTFQDEIPIFLNHFRNYLFQQQSNENEIIAGLLLQGYQLSDFRDGLFEHAALDHSNNDHLVYAIEGNLLKFMVAA